MPDPILDTDLPTFSGKRYVNRSRYAIYAEGDKFFVVWHHPDCGAHRCGTFTTIEEARKSLASLKPAAKRKHLEAVEEFA